MHIAQIRLFPDPQPLVDWLGRDFFRQLSEAPGVYLMRDVAEAVLYVGKAKNLRKRLGSYRVANPDRLPRRLLRLLRHVARIDLETCPDEPAALARESELLRSLQPKFNRAGVWPAPPRFLAWRVTGEGLELALVEQPEEAWQTHGPLKGGAVLVRNTLVRLLWCVLQPQRSLVGMPPGWVHGHLPERVVIGPADGCELADEAAAHLGSLVAGSPEQFLDWVQPFLVDGQPWQKAVFEEDKETVTGYFATRRPS